jgi:8-oxo-dGTP pyrophosphatase MutT (NUDIX family)
MLKGFDCIGVAVTYFCHDGQGKFVLAKRGANARDEQGTWDIGGGGLEFGDTVEETVAREIKEEYGADALEIEFLGYCDVHRTQDGKPTHWIALDFKVRVDPAQVCLAEPEKFDELRWVDATHIPEPLHSELPLVFQKHHARLFGEEKPSSSKTMEILYTNYKGETAWRKIFPLQLWFGKTAWHPKEQWLLKAFDLEKQEPRDFAVQDIQKWGKGSNAI